MMNSRNGTNLSEQAKLSMMSIGRNLGALPKRLNFKRLRALHNFFVIKPTVDWAKSHPEEYGIITRPIFSSSVTSLLSGLEEERSVPVSNLLSVF